MQGVQISLEALLNEIDLLILQSTPPSSRHFTSFPDNARAVIENILLFSRNTSTHEEGGNWYTIQNPHYYNLLPLIMIEQTKL